MKISLYILAILTLSVPLFAQDSIDTLPAAVQDSVDPFSDDSMFDVSVFDQAIEQGKSADSVNKVQFQPGIVFVTEANGYRSSDKTALDARFLGNAFAKVTKADIGSLYLGINYSSFLYSSANSESLRRMYLRQSTDQSKIDVKLSEFHFSFDVNKKVFVRLGSQLISWGATYFWSPTDFINRQKAEVISAVDSRTGKPGIRIHVPINSANVFLFTDFSRVDVNDSLQPISETIAQAWRVDGTVAGVNIGTVGYISKNDPLYIGFDATGNLLGTDIYGECALAFDSSKSTPDVGASIGGSKLFGTEKRWTARTEFYFNSVGFKNKNISTLSVGSFVPFYSGKYYAYAELSTSKLFTQALALSLFGYSNLADQSYSGTIQTTVNLPKVIPFSVYVRYFGGKEDREFTSLFGGSTVQGGVRIRGEF